MAVVLENKEQVIQKLSEIIANVASDSIKNNGLFTIGVSGGSVATFLTAALPAIKTDFNKWKIFFCDERLVDENDADSTFGLYKKHLIDPAQIGLTEDQFVKVKTNLPPSQAAEDYDHQIKKIFPSGPIHMDILLLGVGPDGHTCSLFPDHPLLQENVKIIAAITDSPKPPPNRVTMTYPLINNAKHCIFALCGKEKADLVKRIFVDKEKLPAALVKPTSGKLSWIMDKAAANGHVN